MSLVPIVLPSHSASLECQCFEVETSYEQIELSNTILQPSLYRWHIWNEHNIWKGTIGKQLLVYPCETRNRKKDLDTSPTPPITIAPIRSAKVQRGIAASHCNRMRLKSRAPTGGFVLRFCWLSHHNFGSQSGFFLVWSWPHLISNIFIPSSASYDLVCYFQIKSTCFKQILSRTM